MGAIDPAGVRKTRGFPSLIASPLDSLTGTWLNGAASDNQFGYLVLASTRTIATWPDASVVMAPGSKAGRSTPDTERSQAGVFSRSSRRNPSASKSHYAQTAAVMHAEATIKPPLLVSVVMSNIVSDAPQGCPLYAYSPEISRIM